MKPVDKPRLFSLGTSALCLFEVAGSCAWPFPPYRVDREA